MSLMLHGTSLKSRGIIKDKYHFCWLPGTVTENKEDFNGVYDFLHEPSSL